MARVLQWESKPKYSIATIEANWGKGARPVRAGNGNWVIRLPGGGAATDQTPRANAAPPPGQGGSGGGGQPPAQQQPPAATPPPAPPAPPPIGPPPTFTSAGFEAQLQNLRTLLRTLPGTYNAQRKQTFIEGQRALGAGGLHDVFRDAEGNITGYTTRVEQAGKTPEGSETYRITGGAEGQAYRDARHTIAANQASAGAYFGSGRKDEQARAQASLMDTRTRALSDMAAHQDDLVRAETDERVALGNSVTEGEGAYADWKNQQLGTWTHNQIMAGHAATQTQIAQAAAAQGQPEIEVPGSTQVRPTWAKKPDYTADQIRKRFGANATLVKRGGNKGYTIKYG